MKPIHRIHGCSVDNYAGMHHVCRETKWSLEIHMSLFVANVGNTNATAIMAGGVVVRATEGDGG